MSFFDWLLVGREVPRVDGALEAAVHHVMQATDPRLAALHGAQERLQPVVAAALDYTKRVITFLTPQIPLTAEAWATTPELRALFAQPGKIPATLAVSPELREFLRTTADKSQETLLCILAASPTEQVSFGTSIEEEVPCQEVERRSISFGHFRLSAFARSLSQLQQRIQDTLLEGLVMAAMHRITRQREQTLKLEADHQLLSNRLDLMERSRAGLNGLDPEHGEQRDSQALRQQLHDNETHLAQLKPGRGWLEATLIAALQVLNEAEQTIRIEPLTLWLNSMNVLVAPEAPDASAITLAQITHPEARRPAA